MLTCGTKDLAERSRLWFNAQGYTTADLPLTGVVFSAKQVLMTARFASWIIETFPAQRSPETTFSVPLTVTSHMDLYRLNGDTSGTKKRQENRCRSQ